MDNPLSEHHRTFGTRPEGDPHRAWVDHPDLLEHRFNPSDLTKVLRHSRLAELPEDDPSMPLRSTSVGWAFLISVSAGLFLGLYATLLSLAWASGLFLSLSDLLPTAFLLFLPSLLVSMMVAGSGRPSSARSVATRNAVPAS